MRTSIFVLLFFTWYLGYTNASCNLEFSTSIVYVNHKAPLGGNGRTWNTAYTYLQDALTDARTLSNASNPFEVWVAKGTYYPDDDEGGNYGDNDPKAAFVMINHVSIYGGFISGDNTLSKRNWHENETILSGDIDQDNKASGNSYHVIANLFKQSTALDNSALIDGFHVIFGAANAAASTIKDGAGMINTEASPMVIHCTFYDNISEEGGAVYNFESDPIFDNCLFFNNKATLSGKSMYNTRSDSKLVNCTFGENNSASGININNTSSSSVIIQNTILWNNGTEIANSGGSSATVSNCIVEGGFAGTNVINSDPLFTDITQDDYSVTFCSPAINNGNNAFNGASSDLNRSARIKANIIDIGALEYNTTANVIFVDKLANGSDNGNSWYNAFSFLQDALSHAKTVASSGSKKQIWVVKGLHYPDEGMGFPSNSRDSSFEMVDYVGIYGGFNGCETDSSQRDWLSNITTLSGDIDQNDNTFGNSGNSYHVVENTHVLSDDALLDGFVITKGNANVAANDKNKGAAIYNFSAGSPQIQNCIIEHNYSNDGAIYNSYNSNPTIFNCTLQLNEGGGISNFSSDPDVTNCIIRNNTLGSGIKNFEYSSPDFYNCIIQNNSSVFGGGIHNDQSNPLFMNCTISNNTASQQGGGVYNHSNGFTDNHIPQFINCDLNNNQADLGGGIYNAGSDPEIINCIIYKNTDSSDGGGIRNTSSSPEIINCTIVSNGGGVRNNGGNFNIAAPRIKNCIIWGNGTDIVNYSNGSAQVQNSIVQDGYATGTNVITDYPEFVDTLTLDFDIKRCSPAIDAGADMDNSELTDIDMNARIYDAKSGTVDDIDIGAFEYIGSYSLDCNAPVCEQSIDISSVSMDSTYEASQYITCSAAIANGIDIILSAPDSVTFFSDFEVAIGGTLEVNNTGCND